MSPGVEDWYRLAWKHVPALPPTLGYALFHAGADVAWAVARLKNSGDGVGLLRRNLQRLTASSSQADTWRDARAGMRSYMRYFYEAFSLPRASSEQIRARVRLVAPPRLHTDIARDSIVVALPHMGNWDLVGAWASAELAPVLTVAERLEPEDLFEQFVSYRQSLGMVVMGQSHGEKVFPQLVSQAQRGRYIIALLADRDLSSAGITVDLAGHAAHVAPGPAAMAQRLNIPLYATTVHYERLTGRRRRQAGSPWGVVLTLQHVPAPDGLQGRHAVAAWTQEWVKALEPMLRAHPTDWHMLQAVFDDDLDHERLARRHAAEAASSGEEHR